VSHRRSAGIEQGETRHWHESTVVDRKEVALRIAEIWRYPVKSMAGESLETADVGVMGITGDRLVQVYDGNDVVATARRYPRLLGHRATLGPDGEPRVDDRPWRDPSVLADVRRIVSPEASLSREDNPRLRFDVLPLLVATDGAIAAFGHDRRRLRPNIVIAGVSGLDERSWPGGRLRIGDVVIEFESLRARCVMTTFDPDTLEQDVEVLREISRRFEGKLALDGSVLRGGTIRVGQDVELIGPDSGRVEQPHGMPGAADNIRSKGECI
jgi:uncharacterized protein